MNKQKTHDFLSGNLSNEEHEKFRAELENNDTLLNEVGEEIISEYGRIKIKNKLKGFDKELGNNRKKKANLIMVAVLFLAIGIPFLMNTLNNSKSPEQLFTSNFSPYKTVLSIRGHENNDELLSKGMLAYSAQNYEEAIVNLEAVTDKSYVVNFYLGVSYLGVKPPKGEEAIISLNEVLKTDNDFKQQAIWYKALAFLVVNKTDKAKELFKQILANKWFNYEKASDIIERM